jgi:hypothetical protein
MHQQAFLRREVTTKGEQKLEVPGGDRAGLVFITS